MSARKTKSGGGPSNALLIAIISSIFLLGMYFKLPILEKLEFLAYDTSIKASYRSTGAAGRIAIIAIDDKSLNRIGQWPWPRSVMANAVKRVSAANPKVIALGIPLSVGQSSPGLRHIQSLQNYVSKTRFPSQAKRQVNSIRKLLNNAKRDLDADGKLSRAITNSKKVILPMYFSHGKKDGKYKALPRSIKNHRLRRISAVKGNTSQPLYAGQVQYPVSSFSTGAAGIGNFRLETDSDNGVRSEPLVMIRDGKYYPSLSLLTAARGLNVQRKYIKARLGEYVQLGKRRIRTDRDMLMYPAFYQNRKGGSPFAQYSISDVINGKISSSKLRNKIVIIGLTAKDTNNHYPTPVSNNMSSPEITANTVTSILNRDYYSRPGWVIPTELMLLGAIFAYLFLIPKLNSGAAISISAIIVVVLVASGQYFMIGQKVWLKTIYPALFLVTGHFLLFVRHLTDTERIKQIVDTDSASSNRMLALSFQAQGQLDMAMDKFRKLPVDKSVLDLIYNLALDYERKRQFSKAIATYNYILDHSKRFRDVIKRRQRASQADGTIMMGGARAAAGGTMILSNGYQRPTLGRYEVEEELGKGAMGVVYLGRDPKINRVVAIKTLALSEEFEGNELQAVKDRFFREAETAGGLNHPNIVTIYDAGEEQDLAYIAMEFLEGKDLTEHIKRKKQNSIEWILNVIYQVADALDYAHKQNVVHRDIKPANIMYNEKEDTIKVTDFGIARITAASNTKTGVVMGTPSYMSPEQLAGERVDGRSDLFSLGAMMYELITKKQPFSGDSMAALMYQITNAKPEDVTDARKNVPSCVKQIVDKLLHKNPGKRYQSGYEVAQAVERCANKVL